ncbi:L-threonine kinase [Desulfitispora alkaliphila]|uniref:GHMP family kinase ATP-binding protein n=1 Tax=Desulfitispora alkaliphila TaxID=622674 RepID=UPI003D21F32D
MEVVVRSPGTCGELVQGVLRGDDILVSCPVNLYSTVTVASTGRNGITVFPKGRKKTLLAAENTLRLLGYSGMGLDVKISSSLPLGKGWASSTADIAATCQAVALVCRRKLTEAQIAKIAISIEPTDSSVFSQITAFNHIKGNKVRHLGANPQLKLIALDFPGVVNTQKFNKRSDLEKLNGEKEEQVAKSVELISRGIREGNASLIGRGATISAYAHQTIINKHYLDDLLSYGYKLGAVGVTVAHSGTAVGLLFPPEAISLSNAVKALKEYFPQAEKVIELEMTCGGTKIIKAPQVEKGVELYGI